MNTPVTQMIALPTMQETDSWSLWTEIHDDERHYAAINENSCQQTLLILGELADDKQFCLDMNLTSEDIELLSFSDSIRIIESDSQFFGA